MAAGVKYREYLDEVAGAMKESGLAEAEFIEGFEKALESEEEKVRE